MIVFTKVGNVEKVVGFLQNFRLRGINGFTFDLRILEVE